MFFFSPRFVEQRIAVPNIEPNNHDYSEQNIMIMMMMMMIMMMMMMIMMMMMVMFNDDQLFLSLQEVSIHVYEKRGTERVGRGRRKEAIAEILKVEID